MPEKLYVLKTDDPMPSQRNLWGTHAGTSPEDASARFKAKITQRHVPTKTAHFRRMMEEWKG